ncbi:hypothetical protein [Mycolicibacterium hippocampi]|nr:hypothetical protein [Mycolicibacterium hippocampi]
MAESLTMTKLALVSHVGLLFVVSALLFPSLAIHLGSGPGVVAPNINSLALVAVVLAGVMAITEVFSGLRWPAIAALVAALVGWIAVCGKTEVPVVSVWAWGVAWGAVALWFVMLAAQARSNR